MTAPVTDLLPCPENVEVRIQARLAWNNWPDNENSRREIAAHESRDPISAAAWDRVVEAVRAGAQKEPDGDLLNEEAAGKTATRLLDAWSEIKGAETFAPYRETMAFLGKPNSVGWVWAQEVRSERNFDAEHSRNRELAFECIRQAEERAALMERVFCDACDEAGCEYDNEALLLAISKLKAASAQSVPARGDLGRGAWSATVHDEIIKHLMAGVGMPNSTSLYQAFKQFANELHAIAHQPTQAGGQGEAVAWTNEAQLGYLRDLIYAQVPMAMWASRSDSSPVPLYAAPQGVRDVGSTERDGK